MGDIGRSAQAIAGIADAAIGAGATVTAAGLAKSAADNASSNQLKAATQANQLQKSEFDTTQSNEAPWLAAGQTGLNNITQGLGSKYNATYSGTFSDPTKAMPQASPTFANPYAVNNTNTQQTAAAPLSNATGFQFDQSQLKNDPGYQFQLTQGLDALSKSQNATGITGGAAAKAINDYAQGMASTQFNNVYARQQGTFNQNLQNAQSQYQTNYSNAANTFNANATRQQAQQQQNFSNAQSGAQSNFTNTQAANSNAFNQGLQTYQTGYNQFTNDQTLNFNRAASLAGIGQTANQQLAAAGAGYANAAGSNLTNAANTAAGYSMQGAGAVTAGLAGLSNAATSGINSWANASPYMAGTTSGYAGTGLPTSSGYSGGYTNDEGDWVVTQ